jgi:hypothetical protein
MRTALKVFSGNKDYKIVKNVKFLQKRNDILTSEKTESLIRAASIGMPEGINMRTKTLSVIDNITEGTTELIVNKTTSKSADHLLGQIAEALIAEYEKSSVTSAFELITHLQTTRFSNDIIKQLEYMQEHGYIECTDFLEDRYPEHYYPTIKIKESGLFFMYVVAYSNRKVNPEIYDAIARPMDEDLPAKFAAHFPGLDLEKIVGTRYQARPVIAKHNPVDDQYLVLAAEALAVTCSDSGLKTSVRSLFERLGKDNNAYTGIYMQNLGCAKGFVLEFVIPEKLSYMEKLGYIRIKGDIKDAETEIEITRSGAQFLGILCLSAREEGSKAHECVTEAGDKDYLYSFLKIHAQLISENEEGFQLAYRRIIYDSYRIIEELTPGQRMLAKVTEAIAYLTLDDFGARTEASKLLAPLQTNELSEDIKDALNKLLLQGIISVSSGEIDYDTKISLTKTGKDEIIFSVLNDRNRYPYIQKEMLISLESARLEEIFNAGYPDFMLGKCMIDGVPAYHVINRSGNYTQVMGFLFSK